MKAFLAGIPFAALMLMAAPAAPQSKHIFEGTDPYSGLKTLSLEVYTHTCEGDPTAGRRDPEIRLLFVAAQNDNHTISYFITPELDGGGYTLGLHARGTMDALIDGAVLNLSTDTGSSISHGYPHESIPFSVWQADLEKLSKAQTFQFRINGPRQELQRCTDAKRMRDLGELLHAAKAYGLPEFGAGPQAGAQYSPITEDTNPSDSHKTLTLADIHTQACPGDPQLGPRDADIHLAISANQRSDGGVWYFIAAEISNGATLGLPKGSKLHTQIDGVPGSFNALSGSIVSSRTDLSGRPVWQETTAFHVHQTDLIAITKASSVDLRFIGPTSEVHRCASPEQFAHLGEFISVAATYEPSRVASGR